jgi:predicted phage-related endonuclease
MIERHQVAPRTSAWHVLRSRDLTASDLGAVAGVDPWRSPLRVHAEKAGLVLPIAENSLMRRGRWLEPAVIEALREEHPDWRIERANVYLRDPDWRLGATPDAVAIDPVRAGLGMVQCKVISRPAFEREWAAGAPLRYQLQTLTEAMLADAEWAILAALVIDTHSAELITSDVPRHAGAEAKIRALAAAFWRAVEERRMPAPLYAQDGDLIERLNPVEPGLAIDLSTDNRMPELLAARADLKAELAEREAACAAIDAEIKAKLGAAEIATLPGWRISWKAQTRPAHVVAETTFRTLRISDRRGKDKAA